MSLRSGEDKMSKEKDNIEEALIREFRKADARLSKLRDEAFKVFEVISEIEDELEDLHDLAIIYGRFDEPKVSWEEMKRRLHIETEDNEWIE